MRLQGRTAFVTGASRNIGRAIALAFAAEGADLVLNTRANRDELEEVAEECRKRGCDVARCSRHLPSRRLRRHGENGLAVFGARRARRNAAIRPHKPPNLAEDCTRVRGEPALRPLSGRRCAARDEGARGGSIIALGGQSSLTGRPGTAAVTAAKTGLLGLVRALAAELGPSGIRVNMVVPGTIDTERRYAEWYPEFRQAPPGGAEQLKRIPLGRLGRPEEIAEACLFLASDASAYITGDTIRVMGGSFIG